ncbi:L-seryl-tRNA(Sec) selenium transferase [Aneurinibacillus tyrosinisolvens]|uniref:L-seryl-tRNA(Sec) selenium transferase n=1 Tax=Aneurinibacillus tyrosinisolvens TaxID=1443435 RepID=UPI000699B672|nr:L-seryl-tRNA(Sec) selenium transferase [Aneurinibacillus tyrosinisolvens]
MNAEQKQKLRSLPAVHKFIQEPDFIQWRSENGYGEEELVPIIRQVIEDERQAIMSGESEKEDKMYNCIDFWISMLQKHVYTLYEPHLVRVINGAGVILHTNLGRAVLSERAVQHMTEVALHYSNLEYHLGKGTRGSRHDHVERLITRLTGAESAMVVNNNAAAVFLVLRQMAGGREVIVSRGQLVEIGGSFRVSEIMRESGAILREVGTTNKTHPYDYENHITDQTALLMKVHTSNFKITGFTKEVCMEELAEIGRRNEIPIYEDLGSGMLYNLAAHGIGDEPLVSDVVKAGADIISFSGDKLLGGPQAGIIAGKKKYIDAMKKNQMARVLRVDKVTLAALESTLLSYLHPERAVHDIPVLRDILQPAEAVKQRADSFASAMKASGLDVTAVVREDEAEVGGGTLPGVTVPSWVVALRSARHSASSLERLLRCGNPAVIGRIHDDWFLLDFRTISENEIEVVIEAVKKAIKE